MVAKIIDGKAIAEEVRLQVKNDVENLLEQGMQRPVLATVLVGDNPASHVYVSGKHKACQQVGIESIGHQLAADATQDQVMNLVNNLNQDANVNGILVQLPLPPGLDEEKVLNAISIEKDVDGFHPLNIGRLAQKGREPLFIPCTPDGIMYMLGKYISSFEGIHAVVLGRSNIVGMPVSLLLLRANATVTICHSRTRDLPSVVRQADVLIAAVGKPELVRGDWLKAGAIVIDVGTNRVDDPTKSKGYRYVGDVKFDEALEVASAISPVPGGVGPMTISMLLRNTVRAAKLANR